MRSGGLGEQKRPLLRREGVGGWCDYLRYARSGEAKVRVEVFLNKRTHMRTTLQCATCRSSSAAGGMGVGGQGGWVMRPLDNCISSSAAARAASGEWTDGQRGRMEEKDGC